MSTTINALGSKWYGEKPDQIDDLFARLAIHRLDRDALVVETLPDGHVSFLGNFVDVSYVFNLATDDLELMRRLRLAIHHNLSRQRMSQPNWPPSEGYVAYCRERGWPV